MVEELGFAAGDGFGVILPAQLADLQGYLPVHRLVRFRKADPAAAAFAELAQQPAIGAARGQSDN